MGHDNFASRSKEEVLLTPADMQAFSDANINLWGGIFSGDHGSFRREMYALLLLDITGVSPLQTWIPPEKVDVMYEALASGDPSKPMLIDHINQTGFDSHLSISGDFAYITYTKIENNVLLKAESSV